MMMEKFAVKSDFTQEEIDKLVEKYPHSSLKGEEGATAFYLFPNNKVLELSENLYKDFSSKFTDYILFKLKIDSMILGTTRERIENNKQISSMMEFMVGDAEDAEGTPVFNNKEKIVEKISSILESLNVKNY